MTLLDHDPRAIPLPQSVADAFDLPELFRLLERPVRTAVLDDLLGDTAADAFELHQLLDVRSVDVDRRGVRRGRRRPGVWWCGARRPRRQRSERDESGDDREANTMHGVPPRFGVHGISLERSRAKAIEPAIGGTRQRPMSDTRPESTYRYRSSRCRALQNARSPLPQSSAAFSTFMVTHSVGGASVASPPQMPPSGPKCRDVCSHPMPSRTRGRLLHTRRLERARPVSSFG